jgi:hypothetical protein
VTLDDVAGFVAWLRLPPQARDGTVVVLPTVAHYCSAASVNRKLAAFDVVLRVPRPPRRRVDGAAGHHGPGGLARRSFRRSLLSARRSVLRVTSRV